MEEQKPHFLIVTFPAQGHINPALQFAKRLLKAGAIVTFVTSVSAHCRIDKADVPKGLAFVAFSDGYDDGFRPTEGDAQKYLSMFRQRGVETVGELIEKAAASETPFTCLVYTVILSWVAEVARDFHLPSALLWNQPAILLDIYYYYFRGYKDVTDECEKEPSWCIQFPNLPFELKTRDLPSFLLPSTPSAYAFALPSFKEQIEELEKEENPIILVNTFEELEPQALKAIERFNLIPIGPLLPSACIDGNDPTDKSFGGDLFQRSKDLDYMNWLSSHKKSSVIYVSFGSRLILSKLQLKELRQALLATQRPFLWVIRKDSIHTPEESKDEQSGLEELKERGLVVPWCSQVKVLSHPSVGCFVTHCGWNSTFESLTSGIPMVAVPQHADQTTNAKLVEEVWKTGARVNVSGEEGVVKSEEIKRCLEIVMESEEIRHSAKRWRELALAAAREGGSADVNLKAFIEEVVDHHQHGNANN